jgi:serine protease
VKKKHYYSLFVIGLFICFSLIMISSQFSRAGGTGATAGVKPSARDYTDRMIVVYHDTSVVRAAAAGRASARVAAEKRLEGLRVKTGINLRHLRFMSGDGQVIRLPRKMPLSEARELAARLMEDPAVKYAEPDARMFPMLEPNDTRYDDQWHYHAATIEPGSVNLPAAWDITTGSPNVVVAVIDTGYLPHEDIDPGRIVTGYDFISGDLWDGDWCYARANDGDGRDPDPKDEGDWITQEEHDGTDATGGLFAGCSPGGSSWHGTHVAGTIGAHTNNGLGVAGIDWNCKILHARVLGKCGGYTSDIADAMRWSAGIHVDGVPDNGNPAKVLNLSLGGEEECGHTYQNAINDVIDQGAVVVVAVGNSKTDMSKFAPANCNGVIAVAAVNRQGGRASYSNYGAGVTIAAPGGDTPLNPDGVLSLLNDGYTIPVGDDYSLYRGTSMAAPHVSGVIALLLSDKPHLTPAEIRQWIQATARPFPTGTGRDCTKNTCGAGIIDAYTLLAGNPAPSLEGMSPESARAGGLSLTLTVTGENFSYSSVVRWNGKDRQTNYVSPTRLEATITAGDIAWPGNYPVSVFTPEPGGGQTNDLTFEVKNTLPGGGGGGGGGGCFIATAAFGSPMEKHVGILQDFRDRRLLTNGPGRAFVKFYYEVSPAIAAKIAQSTTGRFVTRAALMPLVGAAYITLHGGWSVALLAIVFFVLLSLIITGKLRIGRRNA